MDQVSTSGLGASGAGGICRTDRPQDLVLNSFFSTKIYKAVCLCPYSIYTQVFLIYAFLCSGIIAAEQQLIWAEPRGLL